jgi:hypothetical protein
LALSTVLASSILMRTEAWDVFRGLKVSSPIDEKFSLKVAGIPLLLGSPKFLVLREAYEAVIGLMAFHGDLIY